MRSRVLAALVLASGCQLPFPLEGPPKDAPVDTPSDVPEIDAEVCTTEGTSCFLEGKPPTSIECTLASISACEERLYRFCDCGSNEAKGGVIVLPNANDSGMTDILYVSLAGLGTVSMDFVHDGGARTCPGSKPECAITGDCAGNNTIRRWTVGTGAGTYNIRIFVDTGGPCIAPANLRATFNATR